MVLVFSLLLLATFVAMSHCYNFMPLQSKFRKCIACTVLVSSIGTGLLPTVSLADEAAEDLSAPVVTTKMITLVNSDGELSKEEERVKRKLALQNKDTPVSVSSDDDSFSASFQREQAKQNARKKTKTERARDLCESLGRGC